MPEPVSPSAAPSAQPDAKLDLGLINTPRSSFDLTGKVAVVLGGTGVLGQSIVLDLVRHGAAVAVVTRESSVAKMEALENAALSTPLVFKDDSTGVYKFIVPDNAATDKDVLAQVGEQVIAKFGKLTTLVCLVGGNRGASNSSTHNGILNVPIAEMQTTVNLNLYDGLIAPVQAIAPLVLADPNRELSIIATSSVTAHNPLTNVAAYGMAKAAVLAFTKQLAVELPTQFGERVRANCITPGFFITDQNRSLLTTPDGGLTPRAQSILEHTPFKRFGEPRDLSGSYVFLASNASQFINGADIVVDAGFLTKEI